ncbi:MULTISPECIES: hypothetical protein [Nostocales]|uniref:Uncharacterized protein n=3 Tax=Nostocales TaxID=1161 RepID=A0A0C1N2K6_9CYAN|nr:hypothetical protein [Tolypothrix bouteillei]KAF3890035.1 hypothetical protein DA73_0400034690 [Tolypothrix bouteillei VB521301]
MLNLSMILKVFSIPLEKYTTIQDFVYFWGGMWIVNKIRVLPYGIPQNLLESDSVLESVQVKTIRLSRIPVVGEFLVWRNQNFRVTKVTHYCDNYNYSAEIEMEWYGSEK